MNEHQTNSQGGSYLVVLEVRGDVTEAHLCAEVQGEANCFVLLGSWPRAGAPMIPYGPNVRVCPIYLDGSYSFAEWCEGRGYVPA